MNAQISTASKILAIQFRMEATDASWFEAVRAGDLIGASRHQIALRHMEAEIESLKAQISN